MGLKETGSLLRRRMIRVALAFALFLTAVSHLEAQSAGRRSRGDSLEQKKTDGLLKILRKLNRFSSTPGLSQENRFLHERVSSLLDRARQAAADSYLFD